MSLNPISSQSLTVLFIYLYVIVHAYTFPYAPSPYRAVMNLTTLRRTNTRTARPYDGTHYSPSVNHVKARRLITALAARADPSAVAPRVAATAASVAGSAPLSPGPAAEEEVTPSSGRLIETEIIQDDSR